MHPLPTTATLLAASILASILATTAQASWSALLDQPPGGSPSPDA